MEIEKRKKLISVFECVLTIVIGVLIAVFGTKAVNMYFGILFIISGAAALAFECYLFITAKKMTFGPTFGGAALIVVGSFLVAEKLSVDYFVYLAIIVLLAFGAALLIYGTYYAAKVNGAYGCGLIVIGAGALVVSILCLTDTLKQEAFWIIVGVLVALCGLCALVKLFVDKKKAA